jgi:predicted chitinase
MAKKNDYRQYLKQTLGGLIDQLDLSELRKDFLKQRWLDQVLWLEGRATKNRDRHYALRLTTIIGGVIIPALVGLGKGNESWQIYLSWTAFGVSQAVAISAALEEFFGYGDNYRTYRNTAESLKIEGWEYFQLTGNYRDFEDHTDAYSIFAERVEQYIKQDVEGFITNLEQRQKDSKKKTDEEAEQNAEKAREFLNKQLELQAQYEAQRQQIEAEKRRLEEEKQRLEQQQLEQQQAAQAQSEQEEKPADQVVEVTAEKLPDLNNVLMDFHDDQEDRDSTTVKAETVEYLSANEILSKVTNNPIRALNNANQPPSGTTSTTTTTTITTTTTTNSTPANTVDPAKVAAVLSVVPKELKPYAEKSVPLILKECAECGVTDPGQIAYVFATSEHESHLGQWMVEFASGKAYEGRRDLGNTQPGDGVKFKGRGFCQVTGRVNYKMWSQKLGIDLVSNPEKAADMAIAARIMVMGMRDGTFTGKKLSHYISGSTRDFRNARRIINALDRADKIAGHAQRYYSALA